MPTPIVQVRELRKEFPGVRAVDGISFAIQPGTCFGLLGPNGAGKTTTLEILEGITQESSGDIRYKGSPRDAQRFRREIGIQFQHTALQEYQTVRETLEMFAALYEAAEDLDALATRCDLNEFLDRDTRKLSGGQRQRLLLAVALVNRPELLFLDEPTTGLDPQSRRNFWTLIEGIKRSGTTILLTTHYMDEAERLCDEVAIMDAGRILETGTPRQLLHEHFPETVIRLPENAIRGRATDGLPYQTRNGEALIFTSDVPDTIAELSKRKVVLSELAVTSPSLEDLFLKLTGHQLRG